MNASSTVPGADFALAAGSPLLDRGDAAHAPTTDFDLGARPSGPAPDVGAYEASAAGATHWALGFGFKGAVGSGGIGPSAPGGPEDANAQSGNSGGCRVAASRRSALALGFVAAAGLLTRRMQKRRGALQEA